MSVLLRCFVSGSLVIVIVPFVERNMPNVLLVGNNIRLLSTRAWVLSKAEAIVTEALPAQVESLGARLRFDLVFVCHTLGQKERLALAEKVHELWPRASIVQVSNLGNSALDASSGADYVVPCEPKLMVDAAKRLLTQL